jgi:hypothetical protein
MSSIAITPELMRRLTISRYVYMMALDQVRKGDVLSGLALLQFHDAVELFLQAVAEILHVPVDEHTDFISYWVAFSKLGLALPYKEQMRRFNKARVLIKHNGVLPSQHDVEEFRTSVTGFLIEASTRLLERDFDGISLSSLVRADDVRQVLQSGEEAAQTGKFSDALECALRAFRLSLRRYRYGVDGGAVRERLYDPTEVVSDLRWRGKDPRSLGSTSRLIEAVGDMGQQLGEAITVVAYSLDYDGYRYLKTFGPVVHEVIGGDMIVEWVKEPTTDKRIVDRCVAFAVDAALRLEGREAPNS